MDLQSYIQLKEAYTNVHSPKVEVTTEEVDAFIDALLEEGYDLSEFTWEEVRDAYLEEGVANNPRWGVIGQGARLLQKGFGNKEQGDAARDYETSVNNINSRRNQNSSTSTATANEIAAETKGRKAQTGGGSSSSGSSLSDSVARKQKEADAKRARQRETGGTGAKPYAGPGGNPSGSGEGQAQQRSTGTGASGGSGGSGGSGSNRPTAKATPVQKAAPKPAKDRMAGASKADRMSAWAKANPTLAKNNASRASTRGTTASSNPMMRGMGTDPKTTKPATTPKPATTSKPSSLTGNSASSYMNKGASAAMSKSTPTPAASKPKATPIKSSRLNKALSSVGEAVEFDSFDIILEYLVDSGFPQQEALVIMAEMSEEKREEILENRRAARGAGGYKDDSKKQTDPSKDGFTGISGSIKDIMKQSAAMDKKKKSMKEDRASLADAYRAVYSEEASDTKKDKHLERGGHSAKTDYSKPPKTGNTFGKKPPMSEEDRSEAMAKIVARMKGKK